MHYCINVCIGVSPLVHINVSFMVVIDVSIGLSPVVCIMLVLV